MSQTKTKGLRLSHSDCKLFVSLIEGRCLSTSQICQQLDRHRNAVNKRLGQLLEAGFVSRRRDSQNSDYIYQPTSKAVRYVEEKGLLKSTEKNWKPKHAQTSIDHQQHEMDCNSFRLALHKACESNSNVFVDHCVTGQRLCDHVVDRDGLRYQVFPDRALQLSRLGQRFFYFLEVDRGSKPLLRLGSKDARPQSAAEQMFAYSVYLEQMAFAAKYFPKSRSRESSFRLLVTAPDRFRQCQLITHTIDLMRERGRRPPASIIRGYCVFDESISDALAPIWVRECDVLPIVAGFNQIAPGVRLGRALAAGSYKPVRDLLGQSRLETIVSNIRQPKQRRELRSRVLAAFIDSGRIRRYSMLESWPKLL